MKTKPLDKPLYLNLYNFNTSAAQDYPYVLTSPRSLEACRKAGYKPVELLYKSLQEYQDDLGAENSSQAYQLYADQEQDRLNKLEVCRAIRKELMTLKENEPPPCSIEVPKKFKNLTSSSSRKDQLDKENTSRAAEKQASALKTLENHQNSDLKHERTDVLCLTGGGGGETSPTSDSTQKRESTSTPVSTNRSSVNIRRSKKSVGGHKNFPSPPHLVSLQLHPGSSSSETSSVSSTPISTKPNKRNSRPNRSHRFSKPCNKTSVRCLQNISSLPSSASSQGTSKRHTKYSVPPRKWSPRDFRITANCDSIQTSCSSSRNSSATPLKRKQVSFSYISSDDLCLSEHDRRILESMAFKKETEKASDEFAYQAHRLWEQDREEREQQSNEQMARWKEYIAEKRRLENIENSRKMEEMKHSLRQSQQQLERRIREKEERASRLRRAVEERKLMLQLSEVEERNQFSAKRRAEVEAAQQQMELEAALWQQTLDEQQKLRLEKAENTRMKHQETYRRRVASANRVEELRHQERWQQVQEETKAALQELRRLCQQREQRAQEKYKQILQDRNRQLKGQSLERAIKFQQVHQLHDELDMGLKKWQDQVLTLQWETTQKADVKATRHLESKRQKVENENRTRMLHHSHLMDRICRQDEARMEYIREIINRKEAKMQRLAQERDLAIRESRLQAQTTADLREHIRRTLSPETFDRKVARVALEMRVAGRPPTASPPMTRSHIFLG